ncbi:MAG: hypothetical protein JWL72_1184 [Ilumatobacteraceae bacterium]|nr:hypothetical protein [Ilumatobacteraceae bacterium]
MRFLKYVFLAGVVWGTARLALIRGHYSSYQRAAIGFVAVGVGIQVMSALNELVGTRRNKGHAQTDTRVRQVLVELSRRPDMIEDAQHPGRDLRKISLHVWEVPRWYRRFFPYRLRVALKKHAGPWLQKLRLRPRLVLVSSQRFDFQSSLRIRFRKGTGLVGTALAHESLPGRESALFVDFKSQEFQAALSSESSWERASADLTRRLPYGDAMRLSRRYGQAVALTIQEPSGEAVGCPTFEVPPEWTEDLRANLELLDALAREATLLSAFLQLSPGTQS